MLVPRGRFLFFASLWNGERPPTESLLAFGASAPALLWASIVALARSQSEDWLCGRLAVVLGEVRDVCVRLVDACEQGVAADEARRRSEEKRCELERISLAEQHESLAQ